ncbi:hypothetical protein BKA70DRAFT_1283490 [Coprinopsis sp. MPI-PUGE-AT-0042]|nr:hypothetical protein BKA70DRAFT_1283490 [Coprinopsis sp. MPI-PUGE-AT-0042]
MERLRNKATKRQRKDSDASVSAITRSADFWFEDGNLVLQAEGTQFKIHKGLLARHSVVLRDMLSLPQPPQHAMDDVVEGCPVVCLSDKARHWSAVLGALYDGHEQFSDEALPFSLVDAMLRLGHKYEFESLKESASQRLSKQFPIDENNFYYSTPAMYKDGEH